MKSIKIVNDIPLKISLDEKCHTIYTWLVCVVWVESVTLMCLSVDIGGSYEISRIKYLAIVRQ